MKLPDIQHLKSHHRIESVVGRYVTLHRKGNHYLGLCPFHPDRHPSLTVDPAKQTFTCYACGEKGDVIHFLQRIKNYTFSEVLNELGAATSLVSSVTTKVSQLKSCVHAQSPEGMVNTQPPSFAGTKPAAEGCTAATERPSTTEIHLNAPVPVSDMPDTTREVIRQNETFLQLLLPYNSGHTELTPVTLDFEVGLSPAQLPAPWNRMRNRIIFPIRNERGELVAFGARRLTDTNPDIPKYINSATSTLYHKSETLYALNRAAGAIRKEGCAYITEGYKDAIAMHAAGFCNTVALCGTACSEAHLLLLKKYTTRLMVLTDADRPGHEAAQRITASAQSLGLHAQHLSLPTGHDPDSLFRTLGRESFIAYIHHLSFVPCPATQNLLSLCLRHPHTLLPHKGEACTLAVLLQSVLETENLPFESPLHTELLRLLADGVEITHNESAPTCSTNQTLSHSLVLEAGLLRRSEVSLPDGESLYNTFCRYLFLYCEARLKKEIKASAGCLSVTPAVPEHLVHLSNRYEQLTYVSERMDRPGTMGANWG